MKILFFSRLYSPHIGGVEKHVEKISQILKKDHRITLITEKHHQKLKPVQTIKGIKVIRLPIGRASSKNKKFRIWKELWKHKRLIKNADLVHIHDVFFWYVPFRPLFPQKPVFTTFHGWEGKYPPLKKDMRMRQLANKFSYGSIAIGDFIYRWYRTKPNIVSYGATDQEGLPLPEKDAILVIGRLSQDNDMGKVIRALKKVRRVYKSIPIQFLGDGEYKNSAKKIGRVIGFDPDISAHLAKASIVVTSSYLSILDSLAAGRQVFSIHSNTLKKDYLSMSPMAKHISISSSSERLFTALDNHLKSEAKPSKSAQSWARQQTWQKVADQYEKLWSQK